MSCSVCEKFEYRCRWKKCCENISYSKINRERFWECLTEMKRVDDTFHPSKTLIFEKIINLNSDKSMCTVLCIGLDPENKFEIAAYLRILNTGSSLRLNLDEMESLLEFLNDEQQSILYGLPTENTGIRYKMFIREIRAQKYEIYLNGWSLVIDLTSLMTLCRKRKIISHLMCSIEMQRKDSETSFFRLLDHFYYDKTIEEACNLSATHDQDDFFEELLNFHCNCLDLNFTLEIALNFKYWFGICVPYFVKTLMLNESERLKTFSASFWPYEENFVSVEEVAKSGFYFTGSWDETTCAFCDLKLCKWQIGDRPILDHFKYKPYCSFLYDTATALNVSDVGTESELIELISLLPAERSIDEVDVPGKNVLVC